MKAKQKNSIFKNQINIYVLYQKYSIFKNNKNIIEQQKNPIFKN